MIDKEMLCEVIESLLLVSGNGLKIDDIAEHLEIKPADVKAAINKLKEKYSGKCGIQLITYNGKVQFSSNPAYSDLVACVLNPIRERDLSTAALETIAIIAYRQPVTRLDIEQIRGVNSEYTVQMLLKNNLIEVVGRKEAVGKPLLFGTTDEFLKRFRLESIDELPDYEQLLDSIKVIESGVRPESGSEGSRSIYNEFEIPDEEPSDGDEIPDFLEGEDIQKIE